MSATRAEAPTISSALIVPAMFSTPHDHWYADLAHRLEDAGVREIATVTPPSGPPHVHEWLAAIVGARLTPDQSTVVVGHSLGAVAALAYISRHPGIKAVGRFVSVAGFATALPEVPGAAGFVEAVDVPTVRRLTRECVVILSEDDYAVPPHLTEVQAHELDARTIRLIGAGHFLGQDGWTTAGPIFNAATGADRVVQP